MSNNADVRRLLRDDDGRAGGVLDAVLTDRTEQHPGEGAVTAAAEDHQFRALAGVEQYLCCGPWW
jgi:hypothetical protein